MIRRRREAKKQAQRVSDLLSELAGVAFPEHIATLDAVEAALAGAVARLEALEHPLRPTERLPMVYGEPRPLPTVTVSWPDRRLDHRSTDLPDRQP